MDDKDDKALFRELVGEVRRLRKSERDRSRPAPPAADVSRTREAEAASLSEMLDEAWDPEIETGEELSFLRSGIQRRVLTRLKRGHYAIGGDIDLHSMNEAAARTALGEFLDEARRHGVHCVKVIHGKGLRSRPEGPVLKRMVNGYLRRRKDVLAFASARPNDGGTGATCVLLAPR